MRRVIFSSIGLSALGWLLLASRCDDSVGEQCADSSDITVDTSGPDAGTTSIEETVQLYFDLVNAERLDELVTLFAPDAQLHTPLNDQIVQGTGELRDYYSMIFAFSPYHLDTPLQTFTKGDQVSVVIKADTGPSQEQADTFIAVDWMHFDAQGKIKTLYMIFDTGPLQ